MKMPRRVHPSPLLHLLHQRKATTHKPHWHYLLEGVSQHLTQMGAVLLLPLQHIHSRQGGCFLYGKMHFFFTALFFNAFFLSVRNTNVTSRCAQPTLHSRLGPSFGTNKIDSSER